MTGEVIAAAVMANDRRPRGVGVLAVAGVVLHGAAVVAPVLVIELGLHDGRARRGTGAAHGGGGGGEDGRRGNNKTT